MHLWGRSWLHYCLCGRPLTEKTARPEQSLQFHKLPDRYYLRDRLSALGLPFRIGRHRMAVTAGSNRGL